VIGHLWHVVPGAHVERMYGVDINPHAYQLIKQCADHVHWDTGEQWHQVGKGVSDGTSAAGGGHAHCGLMIYQGDNWPKEYRGKAYTLNMHGRRINCDRLEREGCGYVAKHEKDFAFFADPWFRGMDLITGPDGGVFIADWSDTGECHDSDGVHRTSGRIYKLTYGKPKKVEPFDVREYDDKKLIEQNLNRHHWFPQHSRSEMRRRVLGAAIDYSQADANPKDKRDWKLSILIVQAALHKVFDGAPTPEDKMRVLFALETFNGPTERFLLEKLQTAESEFVRAWMVRAIVAHHIANSKPDTRFISTLDQIGQQDKSGLVCLQLCVGLQRIKSADVWKIAKSLSTRKEFSHDRMFPIMLWLGIEPAVPRDPAKAVELAKVCQIPLVTQNIARRLTLDIERDPATIEKLLDLAIKGEAAHPQEIIIGMGLALQGWRKAPQPANWKLAAEKFVSSDSADVKKFVQQLSIVFGDGVAMDELRAIATNGGAEAEARRQALRALLAGKPEGFAPTLQDLCGDRAVYVEAIRGLALYDDPNTPVRLFGPIGIYSPEARAEMITTLASRPDYAKALLAAVREGRIKPGEITAFHARQIRAFDDADLTKELTELWGDVRTSAADKKSMIESWKSKLNADTLVKANLSAGRAVFEKTCKNCHVLYGNGRKVGPDITGSNRKNLDYLLENILDPSASVGVDFRAVTIALDDGRVINGVVSEQNDRTLTLQTDREPITIDRSEIEVMKQTTNSLMPDGLLTTFSEEQVRDLIAYLQSTEQVALPE
jgi:putative heme-binding domain-containing protein